jgi:hypothetical protein
MPVGLYLKGLTLHFIKDKNCMFEWNIFLLWVIGFTWLLSTMSIWFDEIVKDYNQNIVSKDHQRQVFYYMTEEKWDLLVSLQVSDGKVSFTIYHFKNFL